MVMRSTPLSTTNGGTWKGGLFLLILTFLSVLSVTVMGRTVSFVFLPAMAIFLWPRIENPVASIVIILIFGLLLDIISAGPLGLWSLIFLAIFAIFRPHRRTKPRTFKASFGQWIGALTFTVVAAYLMGWFALERRPEVQPLIINAIAAITAFPFIYGLRHLGRQFASDSDGRAG